MEKYVEEECGLWACELHYTGAKKYFELNTLYLKKKSFS